MSKTKKSLKERVHNTWEWIKTITVAILLMSITGTYTVIYYESKLIQEPGTIIIEIKAPIEEEQKPEQEEIVWQEEARITAYSEIDSCHFPDGNGGCLNAYNETIQEGQAACPLWIKKGSIIEIEGLGEYTCMDKTAEWVQSDKGTTFDLWIGYGEESHEIAWNFGEQKRLVTLKKK